MRRTKVPRTKRPISLAEDLGGRVDGVFDRLSRDLRMILERSFDRAWKKATREARRITLSAPIYTQRRRRPRSGVWTSK